MFKTILVATDGSESSGRAVETASELAGMSEARLVVLHVLYPSLPKELLHMAEVEHLVEPENPAPSVLLGGPVATTTVGARPLVEASEVSRAIAEIGQRIVAEAELTAKQAGVKDVRTRVEDGDAATRIMETAKEEGADLIVLGRRGLGLLQGLLMGSVSSKVTHLADCACLTVK